MSSFSFAILDRPLIILHTFAAAEFGIRRPSAPPPSLKPTHHHSRNHGITLRNVSTESTSAGEDLSRRPCFQNAADRFASFHRWLTLEPFITPALFEPFLNASTPAVDEWTLSENLGVRLAEVVEHHYATFIVSRSFFAGLLDQTR